MAQHARELETSCASTAQLRDCEARLCSRLGALTQEVEGRLTEAATHFCRAAAQQGQGQYESLRDRLHADLADLHTQVRRRRVYR